MCYQILFSESSQKSLVNELSLEIGVCPLELSMAHQGLVLLPPLEFHFYEWFEWGCCSLSLLERVVFISRVSNSGQQGRERKSAIITKRFNNFLLLSVVTIKQQTTCQKTLRHDSFATLEQSGINDLPGISGKPASWISRNFSQFFPCRRNFWPLFYASPTFDLRYPDAISLVLHHIFNQFRSVKAAAWQRKCSVKKRQKNRKKISSYFFFPTKISIQLQMIKDNFDLRCLLVTMDRSPCVHLLLREFCSWHGTDPISSKSWLSDAFFPCYAVACL